MLAVDANGHDKEMPDVLERNGHGVGRFHRKDGCGNGRSGTDALIRFWRRRGAETVRVRGGRFDWRGAFNDGAGLQLRRSIRQDACAGGIRAPIETCRDLAEWHNDQTNDQQYSKMKPVGSTVPCGCNNHLDRLVGGLPAEKPERGASPQGDIVCFLLSTIAFLLKNIWIRAGVSAWRLPTWPGFSIQWCVNPLGRRAFAGRLGARCYTCTEHPCA